MAQVARGYRLVSAVIAGLLWLAALPAMAQVTRLDSLLSGREFPLTLKLRDLDESWRRVTISGPTELGAPGWRSGGPAWAGGCGTYYTRGQTVTAAGETYLIAYEACRKPGERAARSEALRDQDAGPAAAVPGLLTPDTPLSLSLLSVRTVGGLNDVRAFNLKGELAENREARAAIRAMDGVSSDGHLKQLGAGLLAYARDHAGRFPPMQDAAAVRPMLLPYLQEEAVFSHPDTREPYQPNPLLSSLALAQVLRPAETVAFFEAGPAADRTRGVTFVDGHVQRLPEEGWLPISQEMAAGISREAANAASLANLAALGKALLAYARKHDDSLPDLRDRSALPPLLAPLAAPDAAFLRPETSDAYLPNGRLSGRKIGSVKSPASAVVFYEARPMENGWRNPTRAVLFLNGRVQRMSEDEWQALKARTKIP